MTAIVKALGNQEAFGSKVRAWDEMRARREAAYFDVGVEQGIAAFAGEPATRGVEVGARSRST